jgi:hypothetical protein
MVARGHCTTFFFFRRKFCVCVCVFFFEQNKKKQLACTEESKFDGEDNEQGKPRPEKDYWEYVFVFELVWKSTY